MFPVSVLAIKDILGGDATLAGLSTAFSTLGSALAAASLATFMQRRGRSPGLTLGFGVAAVGGVIGIVAIEMSSLRQPQNVKPWFQRQLQLPTC